MKRQIAVSLSIGALSIALVLSPSSSAGNAQGSQATNPARPGEHEAMRMVPATAVLLHQLDSNKTKPGYEFKARLEHSVHLDNGPELPAGTMLVGKVAADDMQQAGTSKLALRFTQAELKNGKSVPIKATIVQVSPPQAPDNAFATSVPNSWNDGTLQVNEMGVMPGEDLHSKIASTNSGVLVSTTKDDLKLDYGSRLGLAIAVQRSGQQNM